MFWTVALTVLLVIWAKLEVSDIMNGESLFGDYWSTGESILLMLISTPLIVLYGYGLWDGFKSAYDFFNNKPLDHDVPYEKRNRVGNYLSDGLITGIALTVIGGMILCFAR